jgi:hypothetical protein
MRNEIVDRDKDPIMRKERNDHPRGDYCISLIAHVIARSGLAMAGLLCGFYVAADVVRADLEGLKSMGFVASMSLVGTFGFYIGVDIPRARALQAGLPDQSACLNVVPVDLLSATGTFLATVAALISVYVIVFDEVPQLTWTLAVGFCWLLGVMMQIGAGVIARRRTVDQGGNGGGPQIAAVPKHRQRRSAVRIRDRRACKLSRIVFNGTAIGGEPAVGDFGKDR